MASTEKIAELLDDPAFKDSVQRVLDGLALAAAEHGDEFRAAIALDALAYVTAVFLEAHPEHEGQRGLKRALNNSSADLAAFLRLVRRQSEAQGAHVLETIGRADKGPLH